MGAGGIDPAGLYGLAGVPALVALVELVKVSFPGLPARAWPALSVGLGVAWNVGLSGVLGSRDWGLAVVVGLVAGLAASGLYSYRKVVR